MTDLNQTSLRLGKLPAEEDAYSFKLSTFLGSASLPVAPVVFGNTDLVPSYWVFGNDQYGDCVFAGAAHETMLWAASVGTTVNFTDQAVLSDYSAVTGFVQGIPATDRGTNMKTAASYRRKTGVIDAQNVRHKVDAYLEIPGVRAKGSNFQGLAENIASSAYVFGAVGLGIAFPASAMDQFNRGLPWSIVPGSKIEGGHYVPVVGRTKNGNFLVVTWGRVQEMTPEFLIEYADEAVVYVSLEALKDGSTLNGFDITALQAALNALGGTDVITPPNPAPTPAPIPEPVPVPEPQPVPTPEPTPVSDVDPNVELLDNWAADIYTHPGLADAWKNIKATHNL